MLASLEERGFCTFFLIIINNVLEVHKWIFLLLSMRYFLSKAYYIQFYFY